MEKDNQKKGENKQMEGRRRVRRQRKEVAPRWIVCEGGAGRRRGRGMGLRQR